MRSALFLKRVLLAEHLRDGKSKNFSQEIKIRFLACYVDACLESIILILVYIFINSLTVDSHRFQLPDWCEDISQHELGNGYIGILNALVNF